MDYAEAMAYIKNLTLQRGIHLGLTRMERLLAHLGNPQQKIPYVHVGGTNGKGSVCAMVSRILQCAGMRVGLFTSPHLERYTERFQINQVEISPKEIARHVSEIKPLVEKVCAEGYGYPTEFEVGTAIAFKFFAQADVDLVVLEVGLGGALDATNVIRPLVSVITNVSMDHEAILGASLEQIVQTKAGIIKPGVPVVTAATGRAWSFIKAEAQRLGAPVVHALPIPALENQTSGSAVYLHASSAKPEGWGQVLCLQGLKRPYLNLNLALPGTHQALNALMAVSVVELLQNQGWPITPEDIYVGLATVEWAGRLELIISEPLTILDGAHNPAGAQQLALFLRRNFSNYRRVFILGIFEDKDRLGIVSALAPLAEGVIVTSPLGPRAGDWAQVAKQAETYTQPVLVCPLLLEALVAGWKTVKQWRDKGENSLLCITGSLYLIGAVRKLIKGTGREKLKKKYEKIL